jgi:DNA-binding transcriptional LysR family regulator
LAFDLRHLAAVRMKLMTLSARVRADYAAAASITSAELSERMLIHSVKSAVQWSDWFRSVGLEPQKHRQRLLLDRSHMSIDAAVSGFGVALESTLMMSGELTSSALVCPVRDPPIANVVSQWIVFPPDHLRRQKVRLFVDWLRGERERWSADQAQSCWPARAESPRMVRGSQNAPRRKTAGARA